MITAEQYEREAEALRDDGMEDGEILELLGPPPRPLHVARRPKREVHRLGRQPTFNGKPPYQVSSLERVLVVAPPPEEVVAAERRLNGLSRLEPERTTPGAVKLAGALWGRDEVALLLAQGLARRRGLPAWVHLSEKSQQGLLALASLVLEVLLDVERILGDRQKSNRGARMDWERE